MYQPLESGGRGGKGGGGGGEGQEFITCMQLCPAYLLLFDVIESIDMYGCTEVAWGIWVSKQLNCSPFFHCRIKIIIKLNKQLLY